MFFIVFRPCAFQLIKKKNVESETKDVSIELQLFIFAVLGKFTFVFKLSPLRYYGHLLHLNAIH